jgi:hypothetical protein
MHTDTRIRLQARVSKPHIVTSFPAFFPHRYFLLCTIPNPPSFVIALRSYVTECMILRYLGEVCEDRG